MEIGKIVEELELVNDINKMSIKELEEKYLKDEETYKDFANKYTLIFQKNLLYQLRVYPHYKKILDIIALGHKKYENVNCNIDKILKVMDYNTDKYKLVNHSDDEIQAKFLLNESIGKNKTKKNEDYENIIDGIYHSALNYSKKDVEVEDVMDYLNFVVGFNDKKHHIDLFNYFSSKHPIANELNNIYFLYFANYLINTRPSVVTEEFLNDVKRIIEGSFDIENYGLNSYKNISDYKKVANFTIKSINKLEKNKAKVLKK